MRKCQFCGKEFYAALNSSRKYCSYECAKKDPKRRKRIMRALQIKPNKPESKMDSVLKDLFGKEYKFVGDGELIIGNLCPDFMNINGQKKLVEVFGDYWHKGENPQERIDFFKQYGYDTLVVRENELKDETKLRNKLTTFNTVKHYV